MAAEAIVGGIYAPAEALMLAIASIVIIEAIASTGRAGISKANIIVARAVVLTVTAARGRAIMFAKLIVAMAALARSAIIATLSAIVAIAGQVEGGGEYTSRF